MNKTVYLCGTPYDATQITKRKSQWVRPLFTKEQGLVLCGTDYQLAYNERLDAFVDTATSRDVRHYRRNKQGLYPIGQNRWAWQLKN